MPSTTPLRKTPLQNWSENHTYRASRVHAPTSDGELREVVAAATRLKVLGSRHCFNDIADSTELVTLDRMPKVFELDASAHGTHDGAATVTVDGAARYGAVAARLHAAGWAVHNLASLPHISVAGAIATATHGSGDRLRNLAGAVVGLELVTADGGTVHLGEGDAEFPGAVVGLGALGVVTRVTLRVEPTYDVAQEVSTGLPFAAALEHLDAITASADNVSLFTDWQEPVAARVWRKNRVRSDDDESDGPRLAPDLFGAVPATANLHPLAGVDPTWATAQLGVPGPWFERLPHFRMEFTPSNGAELQSEYLVARKHGPAALDAVRSLADRIAPLLLISEIRTVAADDLWLSTAYGRDSLAIHFTWQPREADVRALLPTLERALEPFDARPHWGKLFSATAAGAPDRLAGLYPRLPDFRSLATRLDPDHKWTNDYLTRHGLTHTTPA